MPRHVQKDYTEINSVVVTPQQASVLRQYMVNELAFYNNMNRIFKRAFVDRKEVILDIYKNHRVLFAKLVSTPGKTLASLKEAGVSNLPEDFAPFTHHLFNTSGEWVLDKDVNDLCASFQFPGGVAVKTRSALALAMIEVYGEAATSALQKVAKASGNAYAAPFRLLEDHEADRKRHLQIPKNGVSFKYDGEKNESTVQIPYLKSLITVKGFDITRQKDWNIFILRQQPGRRVDENTPWQIALRKERMPYALEFTDSPPDHRRRRFFKEAAQERSAI